MMSPKLALMTMVILCASTSAFAAPVVLSNPYDVNSVVAFNSSYVNANQSLVCFSDFYYDGSFEITDFHWSGVLQYNNFSYIDGFWFSIYDDNGTGLPMNSVYSQFVSGNANATDNGDDFGLLDVYDFSLDLTAPWTAATGTYYLSVHPEYSGGFNPFYWGLGSAQYGADDWQSDYGSLTNLYTDGDLAWEITGNRLNVVPEPATMTLFGLGLLGSALAARRSKSKK